MISDSKHNQYTVQLNNTLATISNILWNLQHVKCTNGQKMGAILSIQKALPDVVRCLTFLINTESKP